MGSKRKKKRDYRRQYRFWLDECIPAEAELGRYVAELTDQRQFAPTIRDGLRLIRELRQGDISFLFELFPHIMSVIEREYLRDRYKASTEFEAMVNSYKLQIESLTAAVASQPLGAVVAPLAQRAEPLVELVEVTPEVAAENLIDSLSEFM